MFYFYPIYRVWSRRDPRPGLSVLLLPILKLGVDILYCVDYYPIINKLTAREKPMTDTLTDYTEENELEHLTIEEILGNVEVN